MKAIVITGPHKLEIIELPDPVCTESEAVIHIETAGICGIDLRVWRGRDKRAAFPCIPGHEAVGRITSMPAENDTYRVGQRVVVDPFLSCGVCKYCLSEKTNLCRSFHLLGLDGAAGTMAEYAAVPIRNLYPIQEGQPAKIALLAEPMATTLHAMKRAAGTAEELVIFGAGVQGILALLLAPGLGWTQVAVVEPDSARRKTALALGADRVIDPENEDVLVELKSFTGTRGVSFVMEASRSAKARLQALEAVDSGGEVCLLGMNDTVQEVDWAKIIRHELHVKGSFGYTGQDFAWVCEYLSNEGLPLAQEVKVFSMQEAERAFCAADQGTGAILKYALSIG